MEEADDAVREPADVAHEPASLGDEDGTGDAAGGTAAPARRRSAPTIYDVAQAAGVAPSTVSRTFSRPGRVNSETADRIRKVAA